MFTHYGCVTTKWFPAKSNGALVASDLQNSIAPLAPYVGKLLIPRGIRAMNEWTISNTGAGSGRGQGNDPHLNVVGSYFTLQPVTPSTNNPVSFDQATKFNAKPVGSSLDHVIAQQLSPQGTPLFMRVGNSGGTAGESPMSNISYLKSATAAAGDAAAVYPGLGTPSQVFSALTNLFSSGAPMSPDTYATTRGKKISDLVKGDLDALKRFDMSADDKNRIAVWESLLNDMTTVVTTSNQCTMDVATKLGATQANVNAASMGGLGKDVLSNMVTSSLDGADIYSVMAVLAAMCNYNPVDLPEVPAQLRLQRAQHPRRGARPLAPSQQREHVRKLLPECPQPAPDDRHLLREEVRQPGRHARRRREPRRVDVARQHRHRLVPGDVGRKRPQPEQPADHSGRAAAVDTSRPAGPSTSTRRTPARRR